MRLAYIQFPLPALAPEELGVSTDADEIVRQWLEAFHHYLSPMTRETPAQKFASVASAWRQDTRFMSSTTEMVLHPAYQEIIGMGSVAVPLILAELRAKPEHWFWALKSITGVDPVEPCDRGRVNKMAEAWLGWGRGEGYDA